MGKERTKRTKDAVYGEHEKKSKEWVIKAGKKDGTVIRSYETGKTVKQGSVWDEGRLRNIVEVKFWRKSVCSVPEIQAKALAPNEI